MLCVLRFLLLEHQSQQNQQLVLQFLNLSVRCATEVSQLVHSLLGQELLL